MSFLWHTNNFFFSAPFRMTHGLMNKKCNSFVYKFTVNCQVFYITQVVPYKAENWYALSHSQYFLKHHFIGICCVFKGIVKRAWSCKCDICLISRVLRHKRIIPSLKEWSFWYLIFTSNFPPWVHLTSLCSAVSVKAAYFHRKKPVT